MERLYSYKATGDNNHINANNTVNRNVIFDTTVREEASRARTNK